MKENINQKFDFENFDYNSCYSKIEEEVSRNINIMICGGTGVGKSSLINSFFRLNIEDEAAVGNLGEPQTSKIKDYHAGNLTLFDTVGYEISGSASAKDSVFYKNIIDFIDERIKQGPSDLKNHIHEVWYCVNNRFMDLDKTIIADIQKRKIPVCVIITKVDNLDETELTQIKDAVRKNTIEVDTFTYSIMEDIDDKYVQKSEIDTWAHNNLDDYLKSSFIPSLKMEQGRMAEMIIKHKIPKYASTAAAAVAGMSFVNVPFSDSIPLMTIQFTMATDIIKCYGIDNDIKNVLTNVVGANFVSYIGKTLASQLFSVIPFIGAGAKATVNVSVAATITATLGVAITKICEQYVKACYDNGGSDDLTITKFTDFFTAENLKMIMKGLDADKENNGIMDIVKAAIKSVAGKVLPAKSNKGEKK